MKKIIVALLTCLFMVAGWSIVYADLNDGLIAYYPLNGNAHDISGNGHDGVIFNGTTFVGGAGAIGQAVSFDGVDDYVDLDAVAASINGLGVGSFSLWFKGNSSTQVLGGVPLWFNYWSYFAVGDFTGEFPGESMGFFTTDGFKMFYSQGHLYLYDDTWHHAVVVVGNDYNEMYLDGERVQVEYSASGVVGDQDTGDCLWRPRSPITQVRLG